MAKLSTEVFNHCSTLFMSVVGRHRPGVRVKCGWGMLGLYGRATDKIGIEDCSGVCRGQVVVCWGQG